MHLEGSQVIQFLNFLNRGGARLTGRSQIFFGFWLRNEF